MTTSRHVVFTGGLILMLVVSSSIAPTSQLRAEGAINAVGTFTTFFFGSANDIKSLVVPGAPYPGLNVTARLALSTYSGSLEGTTLTLQMIARDDQFLQRAFQTNPGTFWGTLNGHSGSFAFLAHLQTDRSNLPAAPIEGKFVVVEGTGMGAFEGICGGGTFRSGTAGTDYDFTFRFGKDCKAND
jgi:Protein of unknown function (DUF3224)